MKPPVHFAALALVLTAAASCSPPDTGRPDLEAAAFLQLVAAEDARPAGGPALETLVAGTHHPRATLRAAAVRGLGRLERPAALDPITPLLYDADAGVRREAANAAAQAVHRGSGAAALGPLLARVDHEDVPSVRAAVARSLGRLRLDAPDRRRVAAALEALSHGPDNGFSPADQLVGVALGAESLMRSLGGEPRPPALQARLREMAAYGRGAGDDSPTARRIRTVALLAYAGPGLTAQEVATFLEDPERAVRRVAAARLGTVDAPERSALEVRALGDPSPQVRLEAVRSLGTSPLDGDACRRLRVAAVDPDTGVRITALDALARPCPDGPATRDLLEGTARGLPAGVDAAWHTAAHALVAL
ncbi:MAG TPA: HEAT repeat domain-containing protein, partial [Longimicrobiales bacterium]|nr:HEAT repeat domain-containing protein [Longimicrobiales bacterium]